MGIILGSFRTYAVISGIIVGAFSWLVAGDICRKLQKAYLDKIENQSSKSEQAKFNNKVIDEKIKINEMLSVEPELTDEPSDNEEFN